MALTKCTECAREISTAAATCPGCGAPNRPPAASPKSPDGYVQGSSARWFGKMALYVFGGIFLIGMVGNAINRGSKTEPASATGGITLAQLPAPVPAAEAQPDPPAPEAESAPVAEELSPDRRFNITAAGKKEAKTIVSKLKKAGFIKSVECDADGAGGTVVVRDSFYEADFDAKETAGLAFYTFCTNEGVADAFAGVNMIDARTNERTGRYSPGAGLNMKDGR